jgi:hypothetical protein
MVSIAFQWRPQQNRLLEARRNGSILHSFELDDLVRRDNASHLTELGMMKGEGGTCCSIGRHFVVLCGNGNTSSSLTLYRTYLEGRRGRAFCAMAKKR